MLGIGHFHDETGATAARQMQQMTLLGLYSHQTHGVVKQEAASDANRDGQYSDGAV
jgi:hypothetical protein